VNICLAAKLIILQCFARWAGHQWGWIPTEILAGIQAQNNPEAVEEVERLTYRHTVPGAMGYGQVRPGHNPFDPDRLFVRIGAGLEVGFEGDTLYIEYRNDKRAGGGAALVYRDGQYLPSGNVQPRDYARVAGCAAAVLHSHRAYQAVPDAIKNSNEFHEYLALRHNAGHLLAGDAKGPGRAPFSCKGDGCAPGLWPEPGRRYETRVRGQPLEDEDEEVRWVARLYLEHRRGRKMNCRKRPDFWENELLKTGRFFWKMNCCECLAEVSK